MEKLGAVSRKRYLIAAGVLIIVLLIGGTFYLSMQGKLSNLLPGSQNPQDEVRVLTQKVGKLIELPEGETPTVATVSDKTKLSDQIFFQRSENGDKVLIFTNAQKAILYRPSVNKIIEVSTVNLANASPSPQVSPSAEVPINVVIYNGTKISGLAKKEGDSLKNKYPNVEIVSTGNASSDYTKTLIVDLSGKNGDFAKTLASELSGTVGSLPDEEEKPSDTDILIILGE